MTNLSPYGEASDISVPAYQRGFQTLERETSVAALNVEGCIPDWLTGTLLRMGPARFEWGPDRYRHWFDGSGMIHRFSFAAGKVGYMPSRLPNAWSDRARPLASSSNHARPRAI